MTTMTVRGAARLRVTESVDGPTAGDEDACRARPRPRLTRRGRFVVVLFLLALALAAFTLGRSTSSEAASTRGADAAAYRTVVVEPGQTLWDLATSVAPQTDPRVTVRRLIELNGLPGPEVAAGQQLALPSG